jgi:hypothetical protein
MVDASDEYDSVDGAEASDGTRSPERSRSDDAGDPVEGAVPAERTSDGSTAVAGPEETSEDLEALREEVEEKYDFDDFGPTEMAKMTGEEWEAAFDPGTWITGEELLDRVDRDLRQRVADRDVFARLERREDRLLAYSDTGYATVYADGSVEGQGTVLRDVKPSVALCSMESYDPPENPPDGELPEPAEVPEGTGQLGNWMLQAVAGAQVLAGVVLMGAWLLMTVGVVSPPPGATVRSLNVVGMLVAGILFVAIGVFLFTVVANARLSDRFRAEEYRNRLRAVDLEPGERPDVLPEGEREALADGASGTDGASNTGGESAGREDDEDDEDVTGRA